MKIIKAILTNHGISNPERTQIDSVIFTVKLRFRFSIAQYSLGNVPVICYKRH